MDKILVSGPNDKQKCYISGMVVLPPDRLVLAAWNNNSIKLVDVNSKSIISQLTLGTEDADRPRDITSASSSQVAVTVPWKRYIQFVSVTDKLTTRQTIPTDGECAGICCHQDKLVVTYWNPKKLEILDMQGKVITKVIKNVRGQNGFDTPEFVQANGSSICVSDIKLKEVIMLNWDGEVTGRITDVGDTHGLALLDDGSLIVCDREGNRVYQGSGSTFNRMELKDVKHPWTVCVDTCNSKKKLFISTWFQKDKLNNYILVYNI